MKHGILYLEWAFRLRGYSRDNAMLSKQPCLNPFLTPLDMPDHRDSMLCSDVIVIKRQFIRIINISLW